MDETKLLGILQASRFLAGFSPENLRRIAAVAHLEEYRPGTFIFREGETLPRIFLVAEGSVSLEIYVAGRPGRRIQTLEPGELLGWSPLLDQSPMTATARALTPTFLVALDGAQTLALCKDDPAFGFQFMRQTARVLANRLSATRLQLYHVGGEALPVVGIHEGAD
jgi:CRP-like cAMP-binding protein